MSDAPAQRAGACARAGETGVVAISQNTGVGALTQQSVSVQAGLGR